MNYIYKLPILKINNITGMWIPNKPRCFHDILKDILAYIS